MSLPIFKTDNRDLMLLQTSWSRQIDPVIQEPANSPVILKSIQLLASVPGGGPNVVNHRLGQKLSGWKIVRQRAAASIYDTQDTNQLQDLTLYLKTSADVVVDIEVF